MSINWTTLVSIAAPSVVGIVGIAATYRSGTRAVEASAAEGERERVAAARRAWVEQAADAYALGRIAWSHLPEDLTLGRGVALKQISTDRLSAVEAECQAASRALRVLDAITPDRELAAVIAEIHQRLGILSNCNMAAHNVIGLASQGLSVPASEESLDEIRAHAENAKHGSPSGEGLERDPLFELFDRLRDETARIASM